MNVLVIGSGGREHALVWKIAESPQLKNIYSAPGNPGTAKIGENVLLTAKEEIAEFCREKKIDLVVIGPEVPLVDGITDFLEAEGITVFGPSKSAAKIEGDKAFSKNLMKKYDIPTAKFEVFTSTQMNEAFEYLESRKPPFVLKASGLAAGKGVLICDNLEDAKNALNSIFGDKIFGESGDKVVIEEFMTGQEASIFAITDGKIYVVLPASQDHKRIYDGDKGKNTGGMGAYAPTPFVDDVILESVEEEIIRPTLEALEIETGGYKGCLYCGIIITEEGPKVVEFNCRFGDPETQVVLPIIEGDFLKLLYSAAKGELDRTSVYYEGKSAVCVVLASNGYPDKYEKGFKIEGIEKAEEYGATVFQAGTKNTENGLVTAGGRVLGVTYTLNKRDLIECKKKCYEAVNMIEFDGIQFRKDIADKAIKS